MGEAKRRKAAQAAGIAPQTQRPAPQWIEGAKAVEELQALLALPVKVLGEWPPHVQPVLARTCEDMAGAIGSREITIHARADGKPVVVGMGAKNGERRVMAVDELDTPEPRARIYGLPK